jgi:hypothetical protein
VKAYTLSTNLRRCIGQVTVVRNFLCYLKRDPSVPIDLYEELVPRNAANGTRICTVLSHSKLGLIKR